MAPIKWTLQQNDIMTFEPLRCQLAMLASHLRERWVGIEMGRFSEQKGEEVPFVLSCLNTLVNSCQQGSHSAKGQGHLSCVQHPVLLPLPPRSSATTSPLCSSQRRPSCLSPRSQRLSSSWWKEWICRELTWLAASYPHDGWRLLHY